MEPTPSPCHSPEVLMGRWLLRAVDAGFRRLGWVRPPVPCLRSRRSIVEGAYLEKEDPDVRRHLHHGTSLQAGQQVRD